MGYSSELYISLIIFRSDLFLGEVLFPWATKLRNCFIHCQETNTPHKITLGQKAQISKCSVYKFLEPSFIFQTKNASY